MTTDHDGLLADILATPSDDTPRLILADWLDENDQPDRARFIRLSIAIGTPINAPVGDHDPWDTSHRIPGLTDFAWDGKPSHFWCWSRGFISLVSCPVASWLRWGPELVRSHPISRVWLTDVESEYRVDDSLNKVVVSFCTATLEDFVPEQIARHLALGAKDGEYYRYPDEETLWDEYSLRRREKPYGPMRQDLSSAAILWAKEAT